MPAIYDHDCHIGELPRIPLVELEQQRISECLLQNDGNKTKTAAELGIDRTTLIRKLTVAKCPIDAPTTESV